MKRENLSILQLGKFYPIKGGVEKVAYDLMMGLSSRNDHCDLLCATVSGKGRTRQMNPHAKLIECHSWGKTAATMIAPSMITTFRRICCNYDIVHVHHPDPMAAVTLWLSGYKGKVVLHWHSDILKQRILLKLYRPLQDWLLRRADLIIGTSPVYLKESPFLKHVQDKTICLPIGVSAIVPDEAAVEKLGQRYGGKKIVFSLGRLVPYKGFTHLIDAARYLSNDYVVLIGGTGTLRKKLEKKIHRLGLENKVMLLGRIPKNELPAYYGASKVFCLPSVQKTEAFGIVQIEAMSCGKPVVATRIPHSGVAWVNQHGVSGLNVTPGNARELAQAIQHIADDDAVYEQYAVSAKNRYHDLFTKERMIDNSLRIYNLLWEQ